ncbi:hypothetical protein ACFL09_04960 [Planctomycetota bacterium]
MANILLRLCWNSECWRHPTGERYHKEDSYVGRNGFGHEEWNFSTAQAVGGQVYGYCYYTPSAGSDRFEQSHTIHFFAIDPATKRRLLVGRYREARFLDKQEQDGLLRTMLSEGIIDDRIEELRALGIETLNSRGRAKKLLVEQFAMNLCVAPGSIEVLQPPVALKRADIGGRDPKFLSRYAQSIFLEAEPRPAGPARRRPAGTGHDGTLLADAYLRFTPAQMRVVERHHSALSNRFCQWLREVGARDVSREAASVDVRCSYGRSDHLFELKSCYRVSTRHALREALGQLLEYSYYPGRHRPYAMGIVLDATPSSDDIEWLSALCQAGLRVELYWTVGDAVKTADVTGQALGAG